MPPEMFTPTFASSRVIGWSRQRPRTGGRQQDHPAERPLHRASAAAAGARAHAQRNRVATSLASSRPSRVSTSRSPATATSPSRSRPRRQRLGGHPAPGPQRELETLDPLRLGVELLAAALRRPARRRPPRCSARRAHVPPPTPGLVRVGGTADPEVVALVPVEEVVAALVAGSAQLEISYHASPPRREQRVGELVLVGLVVVVGMARRIGGQRRAGLDGQRVGADVRRIERQRVTSVRPSRRATRRRRRR